MKITKVSAYPVAIPFKTPFADAYNLTLPPVLAQPHIIIEIETDEGITGWGEVNSNHPAWEENVGGSLYAIQKVFSPAILGKDPTEPEVIARILDAQTPLNTLTKAGIDIALYDIIGKKLDVPVYKLLGGFFRSEIWGLWDLNIDSPERMAEQARYVVEEYGLRVRACLGRNWKTDVKRVLAIRKALGDDEPIATDANMGWGPLEAIKAIEAYEDDNITYIEQPVPRYDYQGLSAITRSSRIPVVADESLHTVEDAWNLAKKEIVNCFNIKIMKHGITNARKIVSLAQAANLEFYLGTGTELGVASAACAHFAASVPDSYIDKYASGFASSSSMMVDDILTEAIPVNRGKLQVPRGPGLGVEVDRGKLKKYQIN